MQFQATCSKWNKKLTLNLSGNDIEHARGILHSQWYSIIEIHEISGVDLNNGNFFYFDAKVSWILQSWKIQSTDIFKSYKKLTEDLKYDVIYIYTNEWMPEEAKKIITAKVKDGYRLYKESIGENIDEQNEAKWKTQDQIDLQEISGEVLREIEKYSKIMDSSIEKIQNLFLKYHETITPEQKRTLEDLENSFVQTKSIKNIWKIASTIEHWLKVIWEVELTLLKAGMTDEKQKFLDETNALLKEVWSKDRVESQEKKENSLEYKINNFFVNKNKVTDVVEKKDVNSFIYFKNKRELDIYKNKLNSTEIDIFKALFTLQLTQLRKLILRRKLISQNIEMIDNRLNNRVISYTKIIHGMEYYIDSFYKIITIITNILFFSIFLYTVSYIILDIGNTLSIIQSQMTNKSILFITLFTITTFFFSCIQGIKSTIFSIPILLLSIYFLSVNF